MAMAPMTNFLGLLRLKTQVDLDGLDIQSAKELGPFVDCTSNQADSYFEFLKPERLALLQNSITLAQKIHHEYPGVGLEELAVETCMTAISLTLIPYISGSIHVMVNPSNSYSTQKIIENGKRIARLSSLLEPNFDNSRLCIKVPSTWEGLQACCELGRAGIKTLATTLFTMEQVILAAEVGCVSISPFMHELKVLFDDSYHDHDPIFGLCVKAQNYLKQHSYKTSVKACSIVSVDEVMLLNGVSALTLPPSLLRDLQNTECANNKVNNHSLFSIEDITDIPVEYPSFISNEAKFREQFGKSDRGQGELKTRQAIEIFCRFQTKAEAFVKKLMC